MSGPRIGGRRVGLSQFGVALLLAASLFGSPNTAARTQATLDPFTERELTAVFEGAWLAMGGGGVFQVADNPVIELDIAGCDSQGSCASGQHSVLLVRQQGPGEVAEFSFLDETHMTL